MTVLYEARSYAHEDSRAVGMTAHGEWVVRKLIEQTRSLLEADKSSRRADFTKHWNRSKTNRSMYNLWNATS